MLLRFVYVFTLLPYCVKCDAFTKFTFRDMGNKTIQVEDYCKSKNCIVKCCPKGQFIAPKANGTMCVTPRHEIVKKLINRTDITVYKLGTSSRGFINTGKRLHTEFNFIQNDIFADGKKTYMFSSCNFIILEDGSLEINKTDQSSCPAMAKLEYCIDFSYKGKNNITNKPEVEVTYRTIMVNDPDHKSKHNFIAAGMLVSVVFMCLVLAVYISLPQLRNIVGMVLMAYVTTLVVAYLLKSMQIIALNAGTIDSTQCRITSPAVYYFMIASFFWLNVMSFDLWWTIRGTRKRRDIHRQGELVKFMWYGVYAWGVPAAMTLAIVAIDRYNLHNNSVDYKTPFESCFAESMPTAVYMHVPIGIMTVVNCAFFLLTAYNVWLVKRAFYNMKDAGSTKTTENRFIIYIKLCVVMGVSWLLELIPSESLVWFVLINFYNLFVGVAIFILFVCKKDIIFMLCKRFNIKNKFVDRLQMSLHSRSETTKSSTNRKDRGSQKKSDADDNVTETTYTFGNKP